MKSRKNKVLIETTLGIVTVLFFIIIYSIAIQNRFQVPSVDRTDLQSWLQKYSPLIIDLREPFEIKQDSLKYNQVINLPFLTIESQFKNIYIPKDKKVLLVCSDGNRARLISTFLWEKGYDVYYLKTGLKIPSSQKIQ